MLKTRVIPTLLWKNVGLVKGIGFDSWRRVGSVLPAIKVYNLRDVDELILLDIAATPESREPNFDELREIARECFVPLTFGGGLKTLESIAQVLQAGADKVALNSICYTDLDLVKKAADRFGSQCVVASIDARKVGSTYECFLACGTKSSGKEVGDWARQLAAMGVGEILITSIENDGALNGYDLELIRRVTSQVDIPVIASGGAGNYQHMVAAIQQAGAAAVAAAAMFHYTQQTPKEAKAALAKAGIEVRNSKL